MNKQNRHKFVDTENKLVPPEERREGNIAEEDEEVCTSSYKYIMRI